MLKDELYALFEQGKTPLDCMKEGYKKASVYRLWTLYKADKEKEHIKVLVDESERIKKVFTAFKNNMKVTDIVVSYGISPEKVLELHKNYVELVEKEVGIEDTISRINRLLKRKDDLEAEIKRLEPRLDKIIDKYNEINRNWQSLSLSKFLLDRQFYLTLVLGSPLMNCDYSREKEELELIYKIRDIISSKDSKWTTCKVREVP
jgi:hypothetical protein